MKWSSGVLCPRPLTELLAARFGNEDAHSYAAFAVSQDLGWDFSISLFLRTRRPDGFIVALGNGSSRYLHVWLEDGRVSVQLRGLQVLRSRSPVDDGRLRFVSVEVEAGRMRLQVAAQSQGEVEVGTVSVDAGHIVHVGGLTGGRATSVFGGYLKGCIQDLRLNDWRLQFFPLDSVLKSNPLKLMDKVTAGCSGDNGCRVSPRKSVWLEKRNSISNAALVSLRQRNPCLYGGTCSSTWDDFACTCPPKTAGRRCEEVRWCELSPCPADSECRVLSQGYECECR